jgi:amino acid transporter
LRPVATGPEIEQLPETRLRRLLVGRPLSTREIRQTLLSKRLALPVFASDALSSVAYATEAALLVLIAASLSARTAVFPIAVAVAVLLVVVAVSYQQIVRAYSTSGGSYVVARDNLGDPPAALAAAALLIDYVLTVGVSVSAGVLAITSAAGSLAGATVEIAVGFVLLLTLVNLRGARESGLAIALPAYAFIVLMAATILTGLATCAISGCPQASVPDPVPPGTEALSFFLVLKAFSSGASALTGIEAIANGVGAFRHPQAENAARTLGVLAAIAVFLFLGVSYLAVHLEAAPSESVSVLSEVARAVFPSGNWSGFLYYLVQASTFTILILAANASYQGFPRLLATLAKDGFAPRQFTHFGNRLAYSNGIIVLAALSVALIVGFQADVEALVHLYVVGVFTAFTLAQAGMVRHWRRHREGRWRHRAAINAAGAALTGLVTAIVVITKFTSGAWSVIALMPLLIAGLYWVRRQYRRARTQVEAGLDAQRRAAAPRNRVIVYGQQEDEARRYAEWYAARIAGGDYDTVTEPIDEVVPTERGENDFVTAVVPQRFEHRSIAAELAHRRDLAIRHRLLDEPGIAVAGPNWLASEGSSKRGMPRRLVCRVLVSDVHAASLRALRYARALRIDDKQAVFVAVDDERAERMRSAWSDAGLEEPLEIVDDPNRDLGEAIRGYLGKLTADGETAVAVVMHEIRGHGATRVLHNQTALYVKRALLFEHGVIVTTVPFQLEPRGRRGRSSAGVQ